MNMQPACRSAEQRAALEGAARSVEPSASSAEQRAALAEAASNAEQPAVDGCIAKEDISRLWNYIAPCKDVRWWRDQRDSQRHLVSECKNMRVRMYVCVCMCVCRAGSGPGRAPGRPSEAPICSPGAVCAEGATVSEKTFHIF